MNDRVYILLDIVEGKVEQAVKVLRKIDGVIMADALESQPDIIIVIEAPTREQLARLTMQVLASIENLTEQVCLLPTRDTLNESALKIP